MFHLELEISTGGESFRRKFKLAELGKIFIGRLECDLLLESKMVSRKHLGFAIKSGKLVAGDMKSSHGTLHNGKTLTRAVVKAGDKFVLGPYQIRVVEFRNAAEKTKAKPSPIENRSPAGDKSGFFNFVPLLRRFAITAITAALVVGILIRQQHLSRKSEAPVQAFRPYQYQGDRTLSGVSDPTPLDVNKQPLVREAGIGDR